MPSVCARMRARGSGGGPAARRLRGVGLKKKLKVRIGSILVFSDAVCFPFNVCGVCNGFNRFGLHATQRSSPCRTDLGHDTAAGWPLRACWAGCSSG